MIWESSPWREMLLEDIEKIKNINFDEQDDDQNAQSMFQVEKLMFLDAYAIRKLIEAKKIISTTEKENIKLESLKRTKSEITRMNSHKLEKHYDLDNEIKITLPVSKVIDIIIHSYIFIPIMTIEDKLDGIYITSDKTKEKCLYKISIDSWVSMVSSVANSWPKSMEWRICQETGKETIINK